MPDPEAPRPLPLVQPYFDISRAAKPFWPGRRERGAVSSLAPGSSSGVELASSARSADSSSASVVGMSGGGGGRL